jgi:DNA polymerase-3 subunit alpha
VNYSYRDFHVTDGSIVFGLSAVKNVGDAAVGAIIEARENGGRFCSIGDFARRVDLKKVNKKVFESLIKCGAFDDLGRTRRALFEALDQVVEGAAGFHREKAQGQFNLFDVECLPAGGNGADFNIPELAEWDELKKLSFEREIIGFYITGHPLMKYEQNVRRYVNASTGSLSEISESSTVRMAGMIKSIKEIITKKGDRMAFAVLEDLAGSVEVTVFSDLYAQRRDLLQSGQPILVSGVREGEDDNPRVRAQEICAIEEATRMFSSRIHVRIFTTGVDPAKIRDLRGILTRHKGNLPVKLHVITPNKTETIIDLPSVQCAATDGLAIELNEAFGKNTVSFE